jgi:DNA-binding beta-propeller fold protein YncE
VRKLERKYSRELAVVGVHSPKFIAEQDTESVRQAILRLNVGHPVVNDRDFRVWQAYAVRAWPTLMFVDPAGKVIGRHEGEFSLEPFDRLIAEMIAEFDARGLVDRRPLDVTSERAAANTPLRFPGKVLADAASGRLFVSDTGHDRVLVATLDGRVQRVIGSGLAGLGDGDAGEAAFYQPQGLALDGDTLYVADTENHALRAVDLATGRVRTIAGTGLPLMGERAGGPARETPLSSPWDLALLDGTLYVAMAGTHQVWAMRPERGPIAPHTGNGREALVDGPHEAASMNQPSGLATDGRRLYVADSEASAIRVIDPGPGGDIRTIVGEGLFEFGDRDGVGPAEVRLQHPLGVAWHAGALYVADTYNHKIKRLDPGTAECRAFAGTGEAGRADGDRRAARFSEPSGVSAANGRLYVADTNSHAIRVVDLERGEVTTLALSGLAAGAPPAR